MTSLKHIHVYVDHNDSGDHSAATSDHSAATSDHSAATSDHSAATSDHSAATSDHSAESTICGSNKRMAIVLGGVNILLPVYDITNSKRYSVFHDILV